MSDPATSQTTRAGSLATLVALIALVIVCVRPSSTRELDDQDEHQERYVAGVATVVESGPGALHDRFRWWLSDRRNREHPTPLLIASTAAGAAWASVFGASAASLAAMSLAAHVALILLQFLFARRHVEDFAALLISALTAFAPLQLGYARLALGESFALLCAVASVWLFLELLRSPGSWGWRVAFGVAFASALLSGELALLLAPSLAMVALLARRVAPSTRWSALATLAAATLFAAGLALAVAGSWNDFTRVVNRSAWGANPSAAVKLLGGGPWFRCIADALLLSPWTTLLGLAGIALVATRWRDSTLEPMRESLAVIYVTQVAALAFFLKHDSSVAFLDLPLRVLGLLFLRDVIASKRTFATRTALALLVAFVCVAGARDFRRIFVAHDVEERFAAPLIVERKLIPGLAEQRE